MKGSIFLLIACLGCIFGLSMSEKWSLDKIAHWNEEQYNCTLWVGRAINSRVDTSPYDRIVKVKELMGFSVRTSAKIMITPAHIAYRASQGGWAFHAAAGHWARQYINFYALVVDPVCDNSTERKYFTQSYAQGVAGTTLDFVNAAQDVDPFDPTNLKLPNANDPDPSGNCHLFAYRRTKNYQQMALAQVPVEVSCSGQDTCQVKPKVPEAMTFCYEDIGAPIVCDGVVQLMTAIDAGISGCQPPPFPATKLKIIRSELEKLHRQMNEPINF